MNLTSDRIRSIGWVSVLVVCFAGTVGLTLRVNAVKSQVHDTDKKIVWVKRDIDFLQTEFQTRSNQQALRDLNDLEFGYKAPTAGQYIEGERQLAALGVPAGPGAPAPIRYANAEVQGGASGDGSKGEGGSLLAMVSPVAGATAAAITDKPKSETRDPEREAIARDAAALGKRLARIEVAEAAQQ
ncbi:hypothetical protein [Novosphingobium resinovorum]|jgi:hypothetical protein|uniref:Cell division protein FtsL n=1 Tax=Novosphingobium resinovorum TaxID=158500 RepID=A0A031JUE7_9SPHN|nr:hypothetical protein [Novosphingobium resinovorum]AOR77006.1 hypothetical protein BES08_09780 [Novosphingobium resinovorum]EZP81366.1 hypothetical protein BV97_02583 [Novosphingobium resinovorum]